MKNVFIYTDAGYKASEKIAAISFIIVEKGEVVKEFVGTYSNEKYFSINRLELIAIIKAFNWVRSNGYKASTHNFYINTDSQYVQLGLNSYLERRLKNSRNQGYWQILNAVRLSSSYVQLLDTYVNNPFHTRVHDLCTIAMKNLKNSKLIVSL